jgi:hypothetical protein
MKLKVIETEPAVLVSYWYENKDYQAKIVEVTHPESDGETTYSRTLYYVRHKHKPMLSTMRLVDHDTFNLIFPDFNGPEGWALSGSQTPQYPDFETYWGEELYRNNK